MRVRVTTPPAPVVSVIRAKQHLRVDGTSEDTLIETYVAAATAHIDGPGGWLGRAIGQQTLEARLDGLPACGVIDLPFPPLISVTSIKYDDDDAAEQTLSPLLYTVDTRGVVVAPDATWPSTFSRRDAVRVLYIAGYAAAEVPAAIIAAILLMTGDLFANRETTGADGAAVQMSATVERLLSPHRVWSA